MSELEGVKIGELVKQTGVTRATIHHYIREGLLPEPHKTSRNMALYHPDCVDRVLLIKRLQTRFRRSLSEVKGILRNVSDQGCLDIVRAELEAEASRTVPTMLCPPGRAWATAADLIEQTGFCARDLRHIERRGIIKSRPHPDSGEDAFSPAEVDVIIALDRLQNVGFDRAHGFTAEDAQIYLDSLRGLLQKEVDRFLERTDPREDPTLVLTRAAHGIEMVTNLILALRRKLIQEFLDMAHTG